MGDRTVMGNLKIDIRRKSHALGMKAASLAATVAPGAYKTKLNRYASTEVLSNNKVINPRTHGVTLIRVSTEVRGTDSSVGKSSASEAGDPGSNPGFKSQVRIPVGA